MLSLPTVCGLKQCAHGLREQVASGRPAEASGSYLLCKQACSPFLKERVPVIVTTSLKVTVTVMILLGSVGLAAFRAAGDGGASGDCGPAGTTPGGKTSNAPVGSRAAATLADQRSSPAPPAMSERPTPRRTGRGCGLPAARSAPSTGCASRRRS